MARKESVTGSAGSGDNEPAPWETGADTAAGHPATVGSDQGDQDDQGGELDDTQRMERDLAGLIAPGSGRTASGVASVAERLSRTTSSGTVAVNVGPAVQRLITNLSERVEVGAGESMRVFEDIAQRIEDADTVEDVLADDAPLDAEEVLNIPLQLWGVSVNESDFADGLPAYVALRVMRQDTKASVVVTCGAFKVVAKALRLDRINKYPVMIKLVRSDRATKAGNHVIDMVKG